MQLHHCHIFLCILFIIFFGWGCQKIVWKFFLGWWQFILIQFKSECGTAKLSLSLFVLFSSCSWYVAFVELIHLNDLLVLLLCMTHGDVADFWPIRGLEIISDRHTENQHSVGHCSTRSACKNACLLSKIYMVTLSKLHNIFYYTVTQMYQIKLKQVRQHSSKAIRRHVFLNFAPPPLHQQCQHQHWFAHVIVHQYATCWIAMPHFPVQTCLYFWDIWPHCEEISLMVNWIIQFLFRAPTLHVQPIPVSAVSGDLIPLLPSVQMLIILALCFPFYVILGRNSHIYVPF